MSEAVTRARRWRGMSLRARLTLVATAAVAGVLVVGALALSTALGAARTAALDDVVRERSTVLASLVADDRVPAALPVAQPGEVAQLLDADGGVLATSTTASRTLPVVDAATLATWRAQAGGDVLVVGTGASAYDTAARAAVRDVTWRGAPATLVTTVPATEVQGVLAALRVALVAVVPVLTAGFALVLWAVLGRALAPVEHLRAAADRVALAGGPGSLPVPAADDELGALARTLNAMLDRLEVAAARQRAFVADAAHELRSPVAAARAAVEVAAAHPDAYPVDDLVADLAPQVARMQALVDDLLVLARVGSAGVVPGPVDLAAVAADAVASVAADADARGVRVQVVGAAHGTGTADAVERVVRNLVANAVRHAASTVDVCAGTAAGRARVVVDDDGHGIAPGDRERVFARFVRLDEARERDAGGAGLGLAIAREVARELGGDVRIEDAPRGGARAVLDLPEAAPG
ncbi:integral membrane sensor signal transduction histidine kinase [Cellulomonas flavigena DSM 20109]|uniref:histidine kinase n=1 Tax=Cellulomonas flavigena (strain ATCC 482 / DSM 20109 / BCRC 11376 / JCM 18109 / NBRC 3775 / NCIMB 8073 / NRS 134) TaxID=446466 RepID=D5UBV0_CELFN|nr:ATP-binding protein [Cellulomonas flavigena]ADG74195.1 integral membrane sensor signal transduction histidine kinase [Cellulomonas flavigena DSM 20109]